MNAKAKLAEGNFASLADMMTEYANEAVRTAWRDHRLSLDFGDASIEILEQILVGQAPVDLDFQTRLWGSYFGEVIRRRFGGEWELTLPPAGGNAVAPTVIVNGSRLYPLMKVFRRLTMGEAEALPAFYQMICDRLGAAGNPSKTGQQGVL
jgi:hypothetical protein